MTGPIGPALWSADAILNRLSEGGESVSLVTNLQGAWTWGAKPTSGFIEYSHNGLGVKEIDPSMGLPDALLTRLQRRQFFNTGTDYLGAGFTTQWTALLAISPTFLIKLRDQSGIALLSALWNASNNDNFVFGLQMPFGSERTEYGAPDSRSTAYIRWEKYF